MRKSEVKIPVGTVVKACAGRDDGRWFMLVRPQQESWVFLADGVVRDVESPKKKNVRHVMTVGKPDDAEEILREIHASNDNGHKNAIMRAGLARYRDETERSNQQT